MPLFKHALHVVVYTLINLPASSNHTSCFTYSHSYSESDILHHPGATHVIMSHLNV